MKSSHIPSAVLHPNDVGMLGQTDSDLWSEVKPCVGGYAVQDDGHWTFISNLKHRVHCLCRHHHTPTPSFRLLCRGM